MNGIVAFSGVGAGSAVTLLTDAIRAKRKYASWVAVLGMMMTVARCTIPPNSAPPKNSSSHLITDSSQC
jgi:hypothetical protein